MKKAISLICLILLILGLGGCTNKTKVIDGSVEYGFDEQVTEEEDKQKEGQVEAEGIIVQDEESFILIAEGEQIALATDDMLADFIDQKVKVFGQYYPDETLKIQKIEIWKQGRLFHALNNLYLLLDNGEYVLLQGSVVPELIGKYIGREARILGKFADESNRKFKVLEYYIQGVKTDVWNEYKNDPFGFAIKYPKSWQFNEEAVEVDGTATNVIFTGDGKEVTLILQKEIPRPALLEDDIEKKVLPSGLVVQLYHDEDAKEGNDLDKVIFKMPQSDYDFYLAGYGAEFNLMYQSIEIISSL